MTFVKNKPIYHPTISIKNQFNYWTVIDNKIIRRKDSGSYQLLVRCKCGHEQIVSVHRLISGKSRGCITCTRSGSNHYKWKGVGKLSASVLHAIKGNAKLKDREVDLTLEFLWKLFLEQKQRCALTGIKLEPWISNNKKQGRRMSASLDRIDSSKGYVEDNVQWVHKDINKLKTDFDQDKFISLCKEVAGYND